MQVECEVCGKVMDKEDYPKYSRVQFESKRFCSKSCKWKDKNYREIMRIAVEKANKIPSPKKIESAKSMGKANKTKHNSLDTEFKPGDLNPNWKGGTKKYRGEDWNIQREKAIERDTGVCQRCKLEGNEVHHIIPYSESKNNHLDNLITLCKRCHIITERGYSKLIIYGEDILIKNIPSDTQNRFTELSEAEFNGNKAMALKWLIDDIPNQDTRFIMAKLEEIESRLIAVESLEIKDENPSTNEGIKTLDGKNKIRRRLN